MQIIVNIRGALKGAFIPPLPRETVFTQRGGRVSEKSSYRERRRTTLAVGRAKKKS